MAQVHEQERELQREVAEQGQGRLPDVEVLAVELAGPSSSASTSTAPAGVDHALCEQVTGVLRDYLDRYSLEVSSPGIERPLRTRDHFAGGRRPPGRAADGARRGRPQALPRRGAEPARTPVTLETDGGDRRAVRRDRAGNLIDEGDAMSREILEAVREIEREKGIEEDTLVHALEDALLAAYKKTPGAARHAQVELDDRGDFRVWAIELPSDIEERLLEEARERAITELEEAEIANGERCTP